MAGRTASFYEEITDHALVTYIQRIARIQSARGIG